MKPIIAAAILAAGTFAAAQTALPVEKEPQHHLVFENPYVQILDVVFPPGYESLFHVHSLDNVSVRLTAGTARMDSLGALGTPETAAAGRVAYNSASPPYTHRVVNTGATTIHVFDVEIVKGTPALAAPPPDNLVSHDVVIDNARVRAVRVKLAPGESLSAHTHPKGWLEVVVSGIDAGHLRWHEAGTVVPVVVASATPTEIVEIQPK